MDPCRKVYFTGPGQVEVRTEKLPDPAPDQVVVQTLLSAISPGTELLVYRGQFPRDLPIDATIPSLGGQFHYPLCYGYACVGFVIETGKRVDRSWRERLVFAFEPHSTHFVTKPESLISIPHALPPEAAIFLPGMETAVNLVQDAAPILGERALVLGQGIIGLLTASLLAEFPLECLITADLYANRRESLNVERSNVQRFFTLDPAAPGFRKQAAALLGNRADLTLELSGSPAALDDAIALTGFSGRIVIGSWYGQKSGTIDLGGTFHRSRIKMISSQVSTISPELSGRWDKSRRFEVAWKALERLRPEKWITHRFSLGQAEEAYRLLDQSPQKAIQILLLYN